MDQSFKNTFMDLKKASEAFLPKKEPNSDGYSPPTGKYAEHSYTEHPTQQEHTHNLSSTDHSHVPVPKPDNSNHTSDAHTAQQVTDQLIKPDKILLEFETVDRLTSEITKFSLKKIAFFAILIALVFVFIQEWWMVVVTIALYAVFYVYYNAPAHKMKHTFSRDGVNYNQEHLYKWSEFTSFFLDTKYDHEVAVINTKLAIPGRLYIVIPKEVEAKHLAEIINSFIAITKKPEPTFIDKIMEFISKKIRV